ncbi:hypothetical protein V2I01_23220 [Micromonospora sp. BRA006-A]|nr:hypothetical protein [Micromonospora sp. BRA006-A]
MTQDAWGESAWPVEGDWVGRTRPATAEEVRAAARAAGWRAPAGG